MFVKKWSTRQAETHFDRHQRIAPGQHQIWRDIDLPHPVASLDATGDKRQLRLGEQGRAEGARQGCGRDDVANH
jgi:hypothetical protein